MEGNTMKEQRRQKYQIEKKIVKKKKDRKK